MDDASLNIILAVAIGLIIFTMSLLKHRHLKALAYSLPLPIAIALIATNGHVDATNIIGLIALCLFLWVVYWQVNRGMNIYLADIIASITYIVVGYIAIITIHVPFVVAVLAYLAAWIFFVVFYRHTVEKTIEVTSKIKPILKLPIVTFLAFILLSLKSYLAGIVVTFPFSGVFAVVESRHMLKTLAAIFTRNSIAILGLFVTIHYLDSINIGFKILISWLVYLVILMAVVKIIRYT